MQAQSVTLAQLFSGPVRYLMPVFQRPYVWDERQWEPLWDDIRHVAETVLTAGSQGGVAGHFLGAIVSEQVSAFGSRVMTVIDGQQRLTTLQVLLDAAERVVQEIGNDSDARTLRKLTVNLDEDDQLPRDERRFKVWPTNRDREAFEAAMDDARPIPATQAGALLVRAHSYFAEQVAAWAVADGDENQGERLSALTKTLKGKLTVVGITLDQGDNAQVIFETLNFRGTPLLAADLVKNHLFQRAQAEGWHLEALYTKYWKTFDGDDADHDYWRTEVRQGRLKRPRIDVFLGHWLVMKLGKEVASDRIFADFRDEVSSAVPAVDELMAELKRDADAYRAFMDAPPGTVEDRFRYRVLDVLDANAIMPAVLWVLVHDVPADQRQLALATLESWLVRRAVLRWGSKDLNHLAIDLVRKMRGSGAAHAGDTIREYLLDQNSITRHWPDDEAFARELEEASIYTSVKRSVNRMLLEAAEESIRTDMQAEERSCPRDLSVEHVMPQAWQAYWPVPEHDLAAAERRTAAVQTLGNLTLVTGASNSSLSNRPWTSSDGKGKRDHLHASATLKLNAALWDMEQWDEEGIAARGRELAERLCAVWQRPGGGPATREVLARPARQKRTGAPRGGYEIHGPGFRESGLSRRDALRSLVHHVHAAGISIEAIAEALASNRVKLVDGVLQGDELFDQLVFAHGVDPLRRGAWALEDAIHEGERTLVMREDWGRRTTHDRLDRLAALVDGAGWSTAMRSSAEPWSFDDMVDALEAQPTLQDFIRTLAAGVEAIGGRVRGTSAAQPSLALGVPGDGGEVWPFTFYAGDPEHPLRLAFRFVAAPEGADDRFLARVSPLLPSLDATAVRESDFRTWPAVDAEDLVRDGVAEALAQACEEYLGTGDASRWWCIHNDQISGEARRQGGFVGVGWDELGDLRRVGDDRTAISTLLRRAYPGEKDGAYTNWTGMLRRFAFDIAPGDHVISPVKNEHTIDIGVVDGRYWFDEAAPIHKHRLPVRWLATGISRDEFPAQARHEIGGSLTLFRVRRTVDEFRDRLTGQHEPPAGASR